MARKSKEESLEELRRDVARNLRGVLEPVPPEATIGELRHIVLEKKRFIRFHLEKTQGGFNGTKDDRQILTLAVNDFEKWRDLFKALENSLAETIKAADAGHDYSQYQLGARYLEGEGVPQNDKEAVKWLMKAAEQGHPESIYRLREMSLKGRGMPEDKTLAEKLLNDLFLQAKTDNAHAQLRVALMYHNGDSLDVDMEKAVYWYDKAAAQDVAMAQFNRSMIILESELRDDCNRGDVLKRSGSLMGAAVNRA